MLASCLRKRPSGAVGSANPRAKRRRKRSAVTFLPVVQVAEYQRRLGGGGGVPTDGTLVALGLGERARELQEPLAPPHEDQAGTPPRKLDADVAFIPRPERVKLLRCAMGNDAYNTAWRAQRRELLKLSASRRATGGAAVDFELMPGTLQEARQRAAKVALDVWPPAASAPKRRASRGSPPAAAAQTAGKAKGAAASSRRPATGERRALRPPPLRRKATAAAAAKRRKVLRRPAAAPKSAPAPPPIAEEQRGPVTRSRARAKAQPTT